VIAQHVLAKSAFDPAYPPTGLVLADPNGDQGDAAIVAAGLNDAIVTWTDGRDAPTTGQDIFAIQVLAAQTLDVPGPSAVALRFARPNPNPARDPLTLRYALPREAGVTLAVFDAAGRRVRQLVSGSQPARVRRSALEAIASGASWRGRHRDKIAGTGYVVDCLNAALWAVSRTTRS